MWEGEEGRNALHARGPRCTMGKSGCFALARGDSKTTTLQWGASKSQMCCHRGLMYGALEEGVGGTYAHCMQREWDGVREGVPTSPCPWVTEAEKDWWGW